MIKMKRFWLLNLAVLLALAFVFAPVTSAHAEGKGGLFKFFNKPKGEDDAGPVHMDPNISGLNGTPESKPFDMGRSRGAQGATARYEDSSIHKEREAANKALQDWNTNELAKANASTAQVMEQFNAQLAYNKQMAQQQQAQLIAQAKNNAANKTAGQAPTGGVNPAMLQSMKQSVLQSGYTGAPGYTPAVAASGNTEVSPPPADSADPAPAAKPEKSHKSYKLFNKQE